MTSIFKSQFLKYLLSGAINTAATYALYLVARTIINYAAAYTIAYVFGIFLSYLLNNFMVFKSKHRRLKFISYAFTYLIQYIISMMLLWALIDLLTIDASMAPLVVICAMIPLGFILSKWILHDK
jgi:putative flippase GtrA